MIIILDYVCLTNSFWQLSDVIKNVSIFEEQSLAF